MIHVYLVLIPLLLLVAAVFAATEASLFSLSRPNLESMRLERPAVYRKIRNLLQKPDELLSTLIIGNEAINIAIGALVVSVLEMHLSLLGDKAIGILAVLVSSLLLLMFSEVLPKVLAFKMAKLVASILVYPATWAYSVLTPFRKIFLFVSRKILEIFAIKAIPPSGINETDFKTLVEVGEASGTLDREETQMIYNVFDFSDLPVSSVMTPWKDVFTIDVSCPIGEILNRVRERTFSRVPVLPLHGGPVTGVLYTKELLKFLLHPELVDQSDALKQAIFPPHIVSSHKKISTLFREFKLKKIHIALVVDEYGRNLGVVTLEDLLNALFKTSKKALAQEASAL